MKKRNNIYRKGIFFLMLFLSLVVLAPVIYMIVNSFAHPKEVMFMYNEGYTGLLPHKFSLMAYYRILFSEPDYLLKFWRSLGMSLLISIGQTLISCMAGVAFAKYRFCGKKLWFSLMALFMLLPLQVTLLPNYIVLEKLQMIDSYKSLIIPGIFAPFGIIWMTLIFRTMPAEWLDAASVDGAGRFRTLFLILIPAGKTGVVTLFVLSFIDNWNMVEQPMIFIREKSRYPLSVFLAGMTGTNVALQFVCGILTLLPVTLLFLAFRKELMEGIGESVWR